MFCILLNLTKINNEKIKDAHKKKLNFYVVKLLLKFLSKMHQIAQILIYVFKIP